MINFKLNKHILLLFFLFPIFLISGKFLPDLFVSAFSLFFIIYFFLNKELKPFKNIFFFYFFLFYIYININSLFAYNSSLSFNTSLPYIRHILFAFALGYLLLIVKNLRKVIFFSFFFIYVLLFTDSLVQIYFKYNLLGYQLDSNNRVSSFFNDWLVMGSFVSRTLPVVIAISFYENLKYKNTFQILLLLLSGFLVLFSNERLSFFYYIITLFFFIFFKINKRNFLIILLLIVFLFGSTFLIYPKTFDRLILHTFNQLKSTSNLFYGSFRHELHYITAFNLFKDSKYIGHGLKSFRLLCDDKKYVPREKIENNYLIFTPISGYIYFISENTFVIKNNFTTKDNFSEKDIIYKRIINQKLGNLVDNGEFVNEKQKIGYSYEYINGCNTHPHNIYLQFLAELGLFGFFFILSLFVFILIRLFDILKNKIRFKSVDNIEHCIFFSYLGIFLSIFPLFTSGNFFGNWLSILFYFNLAHIISFMNYKKK
jgi:O-antigen ligase